jgi:hypothetical protein
MDQQGHGVTSDAAGTGTLAARLDHVDRGRFVGRETELATLERCLDQESQVSVVLVYGPGGIGKSTLLRQFARSAEQRGWTRFVVEGRDLTPTSDALESMLAMARVCPRPLILIDTYERMSALGWYLRNELLPHLPDSAVVVIAGRNPPDEAWFDGGWEGLATELELDRLSASDALALVHAHGVSDARTSAIVDWAAGSPLALALAAHAAASDQGWDPAIDRDHPEILRSLIRRLAESEMRNVRFSALAVMAIARVTTPEMLEAVLPERDADGAYERLLGLSFTEAVGDGLTLHDLVRKALRADLRRRDPDRDRELRRRIVDHLYAQAGYGDPMLTIEMAELIDDPVIRWGFGWEGSIEYRIDDVQAGDEERMGALMAERGLDDWWALTRPFVIDAPDRVAVARDREEALCGFLVCMSPNTAPAFAGDDAIVGPWLKRARQDAHLGESVLWHDTFDFTSWPAGEMADRSFPGDGGGGGRLKAMLGIAGVLRCGVANPRYMYLPINPSNPGARAFAAAAGAEHLPELDCRVGPRVIECHRIDHGEGGVIASERNFIYGELGLGGPVSEPAPPLNGEAVREALRKFHVPHELAGSPLARGEGTEDRAESVRVLLRGAAQAAFGDSQNEQLLQTVLTRGYLLPGPSHEQAALDLSLSRAAYFRRLRVAADRVADHVAANWPGPS